MQINSDDNRIAYLVGDGSVLDAMKDVPVLPCFSGEMVSFLSQLSVCIMHDSRTKENVDVTSYAYWIRKASIERVREKHSDRSSRIGRGVAFHIAPSNVPVNFAVSMTSSLLAGNPTLIRVSQKRFVQVDIICDAINKLLNDGFSNLKNYICIVRYEHDDTITQVLSDMCDVRVIWGGDRTIRDIRRAGLLPRTIEMTFPDRYSIALVDAGMYLEQDPDTVAKWFYTDTYYTDQNACSSPRLVVWLGEEKDEAREIFWEALGKLVHKDYDMKPVQSIDKYTSAVQLAMSSKKARLVSRDNYVMRLMVEELDPDLMDHKNGGGLFFEYMAGDLSEVVPVLTKRCQTVSVLGVSKEAVKKLVFDAGVKGVDRIVEMGQTMGLEFIWDGYKMIEAMSRFVYTGDYQ